VKASEEISWVAKSRNDNGAFFTFTFLLLPFILELAGFFFVTFCPPRGIPYIMNPCKQEGDDAER
jgi:hypothetical protein